MSLLNTVLERANAFTRSFVRENGTLWRWATVTSVDPVKIRYDGASDPALITPVVLGGAVSVGDRVRTTTVRGQTCILPTARTIQSDDIFDSLESGVSVHGASIALVEGRKALMTLSLIGVTRPSGNQRTEIGVLREELWPVWATGFDAYYSDGSAQFAVTGTGAVSIRWASSSSSNQLYASASWVLAGGQ